MIANQIYVITSFVSIRNQFGWCPFIRFIWFVHFNKTICTRNHSIHSLPPTLVNVAKSVLSLHMCPGWCLRFIDILVVSVSPSAERLIPPHTGIGPGTWGQCAQLEIPPLDDGNDDELYGFWGPLILCGFLRIHSYSYAGSVLCVSQAPHMRKPTIWERPSVHVYGEAVQG